MEFQLILSPAAEKNLDRIPCKMRVRILEALRELRRNPRPRGAIKLVGPDQLWRIRIGEYRAVYSIQDEELIVLVVRVAHRKDVYRGL